MKGLLVFTMLFASIGLIAQTNRTTTLTCNNWVNISSVGSGVKVGDLDISGTNITVEAVFNRNQSYSGSFLYAGNIVSKHLNPSTTNYLLRPNSAEITTSDGYFIASGPCNINLNKTYHVAMVYNGSTLKFYRNGYLMSQVSATGNLFQNDYITTIGTGATGLASLPEELLGYINEVRIWNVARSQTEIRANMSGSLPNPTTQTGLQACYTFDNLLNKQGNPAWNGTLVGSASINATNPACTYVVDSCNIVPQISISNIINSYTPVTGVAPCTNGFTVEDASAFKVGDTVLLIQMKGTVIDSTNTSAFGTVTNYQNAGNYEFNYISAISGNVISLKNSLTRQYSIPNGKVQLIRVPYFLSSTVSATLTCLPWDGRKGGVLAFNVRDTLTLNADMDVSGKGFRGGSGVHGVTNTLNCYQSQYYYPANSYDASEKGEGLYETAPDKVYGRGKLTNGGGGGNSHNSGGGGGSNAGAGGFGGYQYEFTDCSTGTVPFDNRGIGGQGLTYNNIVNKIYLGGGAGSGQANNPQLFYPKGGNGGGIIIVSANIIKGNTKNILSKGTDADACTASGTGCHEGMGGGGGGGTILLSSSQITGILGCQAPGGNGGDMIVGGNGRLGAGGGGGGGIVWFKQVATPAGVSVNISGGINGKNTNNNNDAWGTTAGQAGVSAFNLVVATATTLFAKNIDSVRIKDSLTSCATFDFKGIAFVRTVPVTAWQWAFGDGGTASTQNTSHQYATSGIYTVKLVVTDANGCKDSTAKTVAVTACNSISNIINSYTPVNGLSPCTNGLIVEDASAFKTGDTVLIIQMKGAIIDSTNTASFGTVTSYQSAGNYEFNYVSGVSGNVVSLKNVITRQYSIPNGRVQLIRVPYFLSTSVSSTLSCLPWDGRKGGVLVFNVRDTLTLNADIDVSGKGFRGGVVRNSNLNTYACGINNYFYPINTSVAAGKGESIYDLDSLRNAGRGRKASGGGGGMEPNTGGGGGGNGNTGGRGGYGYGDCPGWMTDQNWGLGGNGLLYNTSQNKIYLGGGGGAGHCNNGFSNLSVNTNFNGGNGGGIVIINTGKMIGNNRAVISRGDIPYELTAPGTLAHDGMGGGGAGGTVLMNVGSYLSGITSDISGARGGNMSASTAYGRVGPGGGGAGGVLWVNQASLPPSVSLSANGGANGVILQDNNNPYGATSGLAGISANNLLLPTDTSLFAKNIDSVQIKDSLTACLNFDFKGLAFVRTAPVTTWQWAFGDGGTASTQNTSHQYATPGTYTVKLIVTDANGCKDSTAKTVVVSSCNSISNIINAYTPVTGYQPCDNKIIVESDTAFNVGDTVLLIQMKGAIIDTTNTAAFGTVTNYGNAGSYEFNYVKSKANNVIELTNKLTRNYTIPAGKVQLVRVPYFISTSISSTLTCLPWDGSKGGVLAFNVRDALTLNADIDISGKGFRGGSGQHGTYTTFNCSQSQYYYPNNPYDAAEKGEGINVLSPGKVNGKGKNANGGGGGNSHNAGGAGGSNAGTGGLGGYETDAPICSPGGTPTDNRANGGQVLSYSNAANKVFLGGGAGAGHANNVEMFYPKGGNGGGIAFISAGSIFANNRSILLKGENAASCGTNTTGCHEGMGGGGGGGTLLFNVNAVSGSLTCNTSGGNGGNMVVSGYGRQGPGGGGGGGATWIKQSSVPANMSLIQSGGINGVSTAYGNDPWGTTAGQAGVTTFNLAIVTDTTLFAKNIDSVRIKDSLTSCATFDFMGTAFVRSTPISTWQWTFGDGGTASTQNTSHQYVASGTYTVKLVVTDANGCKDSTAKTVVVVSCNSISSIINAYTPITGFAPCTNGLTVEDASAFKTGDTVLIIQMKGAIIDTANTSSFGDVTAYQNAGNYEFNYVSGITGNVVSLKNVITRQYTIPNGKVQLIRVPYFLSTNVTTNLTCLPWDGSKGGVLAFNVRDTLTLNTDIDVSGKGFRGGKGLHGTYTTFNCSQSQYYYPDDPFQAGEKGEGIATLSPDKVNGKGKNANGGGGGNSHNAGGAGGSNVSTGGLGGYETDAPICSPGGIPTDNRAKGGQALAYNNTANKVFLGGGAGAGHANNAELFYPKGGNGGGIIFISAGSVIANNKSILLKGENAASCGTNTTGCHEGMGGGGGGGTLLFYVNTISGTLTCNTTGGNGGDMVVSGYGRQGPGGGGGGGVTWIKQTALPGSMNLFQLGGSNGIATAYSSNPWGATMGQAGTLALNLVTPIDTVLFQKNIDSVKIKDSLTGCSAFAFKGTAYIRNNPIVSWQWSFGDGVTAATQNTTHTYTNAGNYFVKLIVKDANGCIDSVSKTVTVTAGRISDFSFRIDPCQPLSVQFVGTVGSLPVQNFWSFGDNTSTVNNQNPNHLFVRPGNYTIRYTNPLGNCVDTITKIISVGTQYQDIIHTPDTTVCYGTSARIRADSSSAFCWFPAIYLNNPLLANPVAAPLQPVTYRYNSIIAGSNLLVNGNFSSGNTGFTTDYAFAATNTGSQQYYIGTDAGNWLGSTVACSSDHTTGSGNMLMVNGATIANSKIWAQTVSVIPHTNYEIAGWLANLSTTAPATLQVRIDGLLLDTAIAVTGTTCNWRRFATLWNSGTRTSIELALVNISATSQGNDFAIDDVSFAPVAIKTDSISITLERPTVRTGNDTAICYGDTTRLQANGAATYSWSPASGLDNPVSATPLAFPTVNTQYIVTGTTSIGCTARDTIVIQIKPAPAITNLTPDTTICRNTTVQLSAGGGVSYSWQPAATLSNSSIPNPIATPSITTTYRVKVTGTNRCAASDSVKVSIQPPPVFTVKTIAPVCSGSSVQLQAFGGNTYLWSPATGLSSTTIPNPVATVSGSIQYRVKISEAVCQDSTMLIVPINTLPNPTIRASRSNDISCNIGVATLTATGGQSYRWAPGSFLSDSNAATPRATPAISTYYTVTGTDSKGCSATDSVLVTVKFEANGMHYLPNAFTPNGDDLNDCFGIKNWGVVTDLKFSIYNRYGELMFYTNNPTACWDGRYKNEVQQSGNFIYIIQAKTSCGEVNMKGSILLIR